MTAQTCLTCPPFQSKHLWCPFKGVEIPHKSPLNKFIYMQYFNMMFVCFFLAVCSHWFSSTKTHFNALLSLKMKVFIWGLSLVGIWAVQKASSMQNTNCWHIKSLFRIICSLYQVYLQGVFNVSQLGKLTKIQ